MKVKPEGVIGLLVLICLVVLLAIFMSETAKDEADLDMHREDSPTLEAMERVGEVTMNRSSVYLWGFDFEDRRCLWATRRLGNGAMAGLTCWERDD